ncbi:RNA polymerase sigma factor [Microbacterium sp. SS28]|uniref:RNA polymerase sigma factor n=1 Tax=Microbacterium sp. SS28 TaxID=2919948 RepID=UPI001FAAF7D4|nr:sigma-70 family RNA polymerase sigma factor [Microbacterium sp. SS28]
MVESRQETFRALFDAHYSAVFAFLRRRVADAQDAEELAADVFRLAWEKQDPRSPFQRGWLFKVASDRLTDFYRRQGVRREVEAALRRRLEDAPWRIGVEDSIAVRDAVRALSSREQEALQLTYWDGMSASEIAAVLGCSNASVWTLLSRARARLRGALGEPSLEGSAK